MDELTAERVIEVLKAVGARDGSGSRMTIGTGLLYCGSCRRPLRGGHGDAASWSPGTSANYDCAHCAVVSVPVHRVDAQLQALTLRRLESPEFASLWREKRVAELDARIAEGHRIRAWCRDPANHQRLARATGRGRRLDVEWDLINLAKELVEQVEERAGLAGPVEESSASLEELQLARAEYTLAYLTASRNYNRNRRALIRQVGGRGQLKAYLRNLDSRLWELLAETRWHDAGPAQLPARDKAMEQDWATSPTTMSQRRHDLVRLALGPEEHLVVDAEARVVVES
ncbi:hypothetical protein BAY61_26880 [Prauserella marina]|uniref:Uncharacterized protein n=1 Tax=Prauserella marina TaxID=530584 RepID=A0A222VVQ6_9PSEU|nr:hypothetical protein [Prauserella marina]ASR38036.1 hypothetical protein BAY61_26880 [Prauserella marina]PWV73272.1 hypothetical protein DES30_109223 [Prauserella marina]SDD67625.1 hypothetical protein SAMN05421630_11150 [Prauserella marina]